MNQTSCTAIENSEINQKEVANLSSARLKELARIKALIASGKYKIRTEELAWSLYPHACC